MKDSLREGVHSQITALVARFGAASERSGRPWWFGSQSTLPSAWSFPRRTIALKC